MEVMDLENIPISPLFDDYNTEPIKTTNRQKRVNTVKTPMNNVCGPRILQKYQIL